MENNHFFTFLIFLLNIALINSSFRNLFNHYSEIHLVIRGNGTQNLLSDKSYIIPSKVHVNGVIDSSCNKTCYLKENKNSITLIFENKIKSCEDLFYNLSNITEIDLSNFDTSEVTSMSNMFSYCINLTKIKFGNMITSSVQNMNRMFYGCSKLMTIDLSKFDTSKVTSMDFMFAGCSNLVYLDLSNFIFSNIETFEYMFQYCNLLIYLNLLNFINIFEFIKLYTKHKKSVE